MVSGASARPHSSRQRLIAPPPSSSIAVHGAEVRYVVASSPPAQATAAACSGFRTSVDCPTTNSPEAQTLFRM